ncbi:MBL fold metallo-hydrolase [Halomarina ordinaria]|uniref:MBL fold metallo-hydrolase n=1 Tax=Halomarina ordinaria TaxID=3033939 RepID=A0ABD5UIZ8_9EURY|nr:MBL fold metallo-hydrolase [Halomarina sp. PSRA2]
MATITFAGSGDTVGSGGRLQTCIHVATDESRFLLDCGASSLPALKREGVDPNTVDAIFLTHLHGDHFGGIPFFVLDAQLVSKREAPLLVAGPPGTETRVEAAMDVLFPGLSEVEQAFDVTYREYGAGESVVDEDVEVTPFEVVHPSGAPAYALRAAFDGRVLTYSGDTEWTESLAAAARGADLFVCEAYFYEKSVPYHLDYATLRSHLGTLDCDRVVLTHMSEDMLARRSEVDLECAEDGTRLTL